MVSSARPAGSLRGPRAWASWSRGCVVTTGRRPVRPLRTTTRGLEGRLTRGSAQRTPLPAPAPREALALRLLRRRRHDGRIGRRDGVCAGRRRRCTSFGRARRRDRLDDLARVSAMPGGGSSGTGTGEPPAACAEPPRASATRATPMTSMGSREDDSYAITTSLPGLPSANGRSAGFSCQTMRGSGRRGARRPLPSVLNACSSCASLPGSRGSSRRRADRSRSPVRRPGGSSTRARFGSGRGAASSR